MSGSHDNLVRMANSIGDFFIAMPDHEEGVAGIANHIRLFWEPRMRWQLLSVLDAQRQGGLPSGAETLSPLVFEAVERNRQALTPAEAVPRPVSAG